MNQDREFLEGYVVDIACLRKWSRQNLIEKARAHSRRCALDGQGLESGYGLVGEDGSIALLDSGATMKVAEALKWSLREAGIRLRILRESRDGQMQTVAAEEILGGP